MKHIVLIILALATLSYSQVTDWAIRTPIDGDNFAIVSQDYEMFKLHQGRMYTVDDTITLGAADSAILFFETPASDTVITGYVIIAVSDTASIGIYKNVPRDSIDCTDTLDGQNANYTKTDSSHMFIEWGRGDIDSVGTKVGVSLLGDEGGTFVDKRRWKASTGYMYWIESEAAKNSVSIKMVFWED